MWVRCLSGGMSSWRLMSACACVRAWQLHASVPDAVCGLRLLRGLRTHQVAHGLTPRLPKQHGLFIALVDDQTVMLCYCCKSGLLAALLSLALKHDAHAHSTDKIVPDMVLFNCMMAVTSPLSFSLTHFLSHPLSLSSASLSLSSCLCALLCVRA